MDETSSDTARPKFCIYCGKKLDEDAIYCPQCGKPVKKRSSPKMKSAGTSVIPNKTPVGAIPPPVKFNQYQNYEQTYRGVQQKPAKQITTPESITGVSSPIFNKKDLQNIGVIGFVAYLSHLLRYLIIYNRLPSFYEFIIPLPIYIIAIFAFYAMYKKYLQNAGVEVNFETDRFDFTVSLVLSTFFITSLPFRTSINQDKTTVPNEVYKTESSKFGVRQVVLPKMTYIGGFIKPKSYFIMTLIAIIIGGLFLYFYVKFDYKDFNSTFRLIAAYFGSLAVVNVAPSFGKYNLEMSKIGRLRTLLLFLVAISITLLALLGNSFLIALQNR